MCGMMDTENLLRLSSPECSQHMAGCVCEAGKVIDNAGNCVAPNECKCVYDKKLFAIDEKMYTKDKCMSW